MHENTNTSEYQGIGIRLAAQIVDGIIFAVIFWIVGRSIASSYGGLTPSGFQMTGTPAFLTNGILFVIGLAYFTILEGTIGATVGKMVCKIKVVKEDGSPCDLPAAFIRNILRIVDALPFFYILGVIFIARSDKKQRLGDKVANTIVVNK